MNQPSNTKHEVSVSGGLVRIAEVFGLCNITLVKNIARCQNLAMPLC